MRLSRIIVGLLVALCCATVPSLAAKADQAILVLDASGSMWGQIQGQPKIEIARNVIGDLLEDWSPTVALGVIAYGHREKGNCGDIETLVPIGPVAVDAIQSRLTSLNPKGETPLTDAVRLAAKELRSEKAKATVVLVTDGPETCAADPCAAARELEAAGVDFTVHVVGFDLDQADNAQLKCLADNTGGRFLSAATASELKQAITEAATLVVKPQSAPQRAVKVQPAPMGWISLVNADRGLAIYDQANQRVGYVTIHGREALAVGRYRLEAGNLTLGGIEIKAGEETKIDLAATVGWISLVNADGGLHIFDQAGKRVGFVSTHEREELAAGTYRLEAGSLTLEGIEIQPGEETMVDLASKVGWISLLNVDGGLQIYDQAGRRVGFVGAHERKQLAVGRYHLKSRRVEVDVEVKAGEEVVVEAGS